MATIIKEEIKEEIATRLVQQEALGHDKEYQGEWYVVNGDKVVHAERNRPWNPWGDDDAVIAVDELIFELGGAGDENASFTSEPQYDEDGDVIELSEEETTAEFEAQVSFALGYVPDEY